MNEIDIAHTAVVVIDVQKDYFLGGRFPLWKSTKALKAVIKVVNEARKDNLPVIWIRHEGLSPKSTFLSAGTDGCSLHPSLPVFSGDAVIVKHEPDSFQDTALDALLKEKGIETVIWMGMMTWMCVDTTVRAAFKMGYRNILVTDATASGWLKDSKGLIFPWHTQRSFIASLGAKFAAACVSRDWRKTLY